MKERQRATVDTAGGEQPILVTIGGVEHALPIDEAERLRDDLQTALCRLTLDRGEAASRMSDQCVTPTGRTDRHGQYVCSVNGVLCCEFCKEPL
jgi:hypothetical protein